MQLKVSAHNVRIAPRKLRLVADSVRGKKALEAQRILEFAAKKGAGPMLKLLNSAIANAKHNNKVEAANLVLKTVMVNEGFVIKRFRPRAFGRAAMIRKKTSHIILVVEEVKQDAKKSVTEKSAKAETPKKPVAKKETTKPAAKKAAASKTTKK